MADATNHVLEKKIRGASAQPLLWLVRIPVAGMALCQQFKVFVAKLVLVSNSDAPRVIPSVSPLLSCSPLWGSIMGKQIEKLLVLWCSALQWYSAISSSVSVEFKVAPPITPLCYRALIAEPHSKYGLLSMHYAIMGSELIEFNEVHQGPLWWVVVWPVFIFFVLDLFPRWPIMSQTKQ